MARTANNSTLFPGLFMTGNLIREEDVQEVQELLNFVFQDIGRNHLYVRCSEAGWGDSGNEVTTHGITLANTSGDVVWYRFQIWVDADVQDLTVGAMVTIPAGNDVDVTITIGGASGTLSLDNTTQNDAVTLATSSTGTGLLTCSVGFDHTNGSDDCTPEWFFVREDTPAIPAPPDE